MRRIRAARISAWLVLVLAGAGCGAGRSGSDALATSPSPSVTGSPSTPSPPVAESPSPAPSPRVAGGIAGSWFAVVGDFGSGNEQERDVANAIRMAHRTTPLTALVTTGDNVYPHGSPATFRAAWHEPYGWVQREGLPVVASLGNHDVETADGARVMRLLGMPDRWYVEQHGPLELIVLDSNQPHDREQLDAAVSAATRSTAAWQVAVFHHPPFSCGSHGSTEWMRQEWTPSLIDAGVDLVLTGHDHNYQRFVATGGATFVVTGGGGAGLYPMKGCATGTPQPVASFVAHHYLLIEASDSALRIDAVRVPEGTIGDSVTLQATS